MTAPSSEGPARRIKLVHRRSSDLCQLLRRNQLGIIAVQCGGRTDVTAVDDQTPEPQLLAPTLAALNRRLLRQAGTVGENPVDQHAEQPGTLRHSTRACHGRHLVLEHHLACEKVALAIVTTENEVVLLVKPLELLIGPELALANATPGTSTNKRGCHHGPNTIKKASRQQSWEAVHAARLDQLLETPVTPVLGQILVEVWTCRKKYQVAAWCGGAPSPVQNLQQAQKTRIDGVSWEASVAAGGEEASAGAEGVVDVAEHLDPRCSAELRPRTRSLLGEVQEQLFPPRGVCEIKVHKLVKIVIPTTAINEVLQHC
mmetsp:Transcript_35428/g.101160  ORF Transcript_35428/g.101160 Transcript_35428/m.101160 type:complete len:315 (-) Transcript_35428:67-1011(-)